MIAILRAPITTTSNKGDVRHWDGSVKTVYFYKKINPCPITDNRYSIHSKNEDVLFSHAESTNQNVVALQVRLLFSASIESK